MESKIEAHMIKSASRLLIVRNVIFLILMLIHFSLYFDIRPSLNILKIILASLCGVLLIAVYVHHTISAFKAAKNEYVRTAFQDEYFKMIKIKSGYHGFTAMCAACILLIFLVLIFPVISLPPMLSTEIILFAGVSVSDLSKIIFSRG